MRNIDPDPGACSSPGQEARPVWTAPRVLALAPASAARNGSVVSYPEGVATFSGLFIGAAS